MQRRGFHRLLAASAAGAALPGCALFTGGGDGGIVELAGGRPIDRDTLLATLRTSDFVLLGEQHDNPRHHALRAGLLAALGPGHTVVAEPLQAGRQVATGGDLLAALQAAGFDPRGWGWPLHEPPFRAAIESGQRLLGGNVARELARDIARRGAEAQPPALRALIDAAPLADAARAALDADLVAGHCGQLGGARLDAMRAAQRTRDASMAQVMLDAAAPGRPVLLLAGNGHVRRDYGVAQLLAAQRPRAAIVALWFAEAGDGWPGGGAAATAYTHRWATRGVRRADPCAGFTLPAAR